jgi:hypothetical protein
MYDKSLCTQSRALATPGTLVAVCAGNDDSRIYISVQSNQHQPMRKQKIIKKQKKNGRRHVKQRPCNT